MTQGPAGQYLTASPGQAIAGKISWFTGGATALPGGNTSQPGIAFYDQSTLGGYWLIKGPNGHMAILRQIDIGPAPWTGRKFDFTPGGASALGYSTSSFPTDSQASGVYLGKTAADLTKTVSSAAAKLSGVADLPHPNITPQQAQQLIAAANKTGAKGIGISPGPATPAGVAKAVGNAVSSVPDAITGVFNQAVSDLKYGAVLAVVIIAAGFLIVRGVGGDRVAERLATRGAGG